MEGSKFSAALTISMMVVMVFVRCWSTSTSTCTSQRRCNNLCSCCTRSHGLSLRLALLNFVTFRSSFKYSVDYAGRSEMKDTGGAINGGDNGVVLEEIDLEETKTRLFACSLL